MQKQNMLNGILTLVVDAIILTITSVVSKSPSITLLFFAIAHVIIHLGFFNTMLKVDENLKNKYLIFTGKIMTILTILVSFIRGLLIWLGFVTGF